MTRDPTFAITAFDLHSVLAHRRRLNERVPLALKLNQDLPYRLFSFRVTCHREKPAKPMEPNSRFT